MPEAGAPEGGCFLSVPTAQAAAGEGTEPCRMRGLSWRASLAKETSPGTRMEEILQRGKRGG